jgi:aspartate/methionine/tyrosine aminotransferase
LVHENLTQMQLLGVGSGTNVAEGHPRQALTPAQRAIVDRFPDFIAEAASEAFPVLDNRAHQAFFSALGQDSAPVGSGRIVSLYSSSTGIDIVCRCLADFATTVGVIHPTLDCVPALLEGRGLKLVPLSERSLKVDDPVANFSSPVEAVFVASPNNPTGTVMSAETLAALASSCRDHDIPLVLDSCFRAFDPRMQYDTYTVLEASGAEYVVIEDTGKLWPFAGIKLGFVVFSTGGRMPIPAAASDILLTAPAFSVLVVEALSEDMANGGLDALQSFIAANRALLKDTVKDVEGVKLANAGSRASVAMLRMPKGLPSTRVWGGLLRANVHTVPCRPFYWARPAEGEQFLRVALARDPEVVGRAGSAIAAVVAAA